MSDAFWGGIRDEKEEVINNIYWLCEQYDIERPSLNTKMRIEVLQEEKNKIISLVDSKR